MLHVLHKPQAAWISRSIRKEPLNHDWTDVRFVVEIAGNFGAQKKTTIKLRRKERDYEGFTHGYKLHSAKGHATIATATATATATCTKQMRLCFSIWLLDFIYVSVPLSVALLFWRLCKIVACNYWPLLLGPLTKQPELYHRPELVVTRKLATSPLQLTTYNWQLATGNFTHASMSS